MQCENYLLGVLPNNPIVTDPGSFPSVLSRVALVSEIQTRSKVYHHSKGCNRNRYPIKTRIEGLRSAIYPTPYPTV